MVAEKKAGYDPYEKFGVRLTEVVSPMERVNRLRD